MSDETRYCNCYDPWNCREPLVDRPCRPWTKRERENAERADDLQSKLSTVQKRYEEYAGDCYACTPFLAEGEKPVDCIKRNRHDASQALELLAKALGRAESLGAELDEIKGVVGFPGTIALDKHGLSDSLPDVVRYCHREWLDQTHSSQQRYLKEQARADAAESRLCRIYERAHAAVSSPFDSHDWRALQSALDDIAGAAFGLETPPPDTSSVVSGDSAGGDTQMVVERRFPPPGRKNTPCPDCGCWEGEYHRDGCLQLSASE